MSLFKDRRFIRQIFKTVNEQYKRLSKTKEIFEKRLVEKAINDDKSL